MIFASGVFSVCPVWNPKLGILQKCVSPEADIKLLKKIRHQLLAIWNHWKSDSDGETKKLNKHTGMSCWYLVNGL